MYSLHANDLYNVYSRQMADALNLPAKGIILRMISRVFFLARAYRELYILWSFEGVVMGAGGQFAALQSETISSTLMGVMMCE